MRSMMLMLILVSSGCSISRTEVRVERSFEIAAWHPLLPIGVKVACSEKTCPVVVTESVVITRLPAVDLCGDL